MYVCYFRSGPTASICTVQKMAVKIKFRVKNFSHSWRQHMCASGSERLGSTRRARRRLSWAETRARRLRQFVFCAFTCHPNGGISRILAFLSRTDKKSIHFHLIIIKCGREASSQRCGEPSRRRPSICFERFLCIVCEKRLTSYNIFLLPCDQAASELHALCDPSGNGAMSG